MFWKSFVLKVIWKHTKHTLFYIQSKNSLSIYEIKDLERKVKFWLWVNGKKTTQRVWVAPEASFWKHTNSPLQCALILRIFPFLLAIYSFDTRTLMLHLTFSLPFMIRLTFFLEVDVNLFTRFKCTRT